MFAWYLRPASILLAAGIAMKFPTIMVARPKRGCVLGLHLALLRMSTACGAVMAVFVWRALYIASSC